MKFSEIQLNAASQSAIIGVQKHTPKISLFAKSFSSRPGQPYNGVAVPIFGNVSGVQRYSTGYGGVSGDGLLADKYCNGEMLQGAVIPLDKLFVKSYTLTDYEVGSTDNLYLADGARGIAEQLGLDIANYVFHDVMDDAAIGANAGSVVGVPSTKKGFASLFAAAADNGADPYNCVVALDAPTFASLLGEMDSLVYGGPEAVRNGVLPGLYGFRGVVCVPTTPTATTKGWIIPWESIGVASRYNKPAVEGYDASWAATDEKTGMTVGYRVFEHLCKGVAMMAGDVLFGAKLIAPDKIVKITGS